MKNCSLIVVLLAAGATLGCYGGDAGDPNLRRTSEESLTAGLEAMEAGNHDQAFELLGQAIQGGLNADMYSEALVHHAVAAAHLGKFDEAENDFEMLDQGATNMDEVLAAKSFLRGKQGKKATAKSLMQQARRLNPRVKAFE